MTKQWNGKLGGTVRIKNGEQASVALWQNHTEESHPLTVTAQVAAAVRRGPLRPYVAVDFGTGAAVVKLEADIGLGVCFPVAGSYIHVRVGADAVAPPNDEVADLCGLVSFVRAKATEPLVRTRYVDQLATGQTAKILIPAFSKSFSLHLEEGDGREVEVRTFNNEGKNSFSLWAWKMKTPLPNDAVSMEVFNSGRLPLSMRLVFDLTIGDAK